MFINFKIYYSIKHNGTSIIIKETLKHHERERCNTCEYKLRLFKHTETSLTITAV